MESAAEEKKKQGNEEHKKGNYQAAVRCYTDAISKLDPLTAIDLNPNEPSFYTNRAFSNIYLKEYRRAIDDCEQSLQVNPQFARAYKRLFKCYLCIGDFEVGSTHY